MQPLKESLPSRSKRKREFFQIEIRKKQNNAFFTHRRKKLLRLSKPFSSNLDVFDKEENIRQLAISLQKAILDNNAGQTKTTLRELDIILSQCQDTDEYPSTLLIESQTIFSLFSLLDKEFLHDMEIFSTSLKLFKKYSLQCLFLFTERS